ncbi:MAG TPA: hypothetical protein VFB62_06940 [Polyangiaceae bacterium]|nr:hypothetical protein [Polyangiaceae bacterium]
MNALAVLSMVERFVRHHLNADETAALLGGEVRRLDAHTLAVESSSVAEAHLEELAGELVGMVLSFAPALSITSEEWQQRFGPAIERPPKPHIFDQIDRQFSIEEDDVRAHIRVTVPRDSTGSEWPVKRLIVRRAPRRDHGH